MLIEFRVANHRSIRDEQVLTMEAGRLGGAGDPRQRQVDGYGKPLLTVAAIYGANASGKSNVLSALAFVRDAVVHSHRSWSPEGGVPRDPFAWEPSRTEPSTFEIAVVQHGVRYMYGFVLDDDRFLEEWLFAWPKGRKQTWFERDGDTFKFGEHLQGENRVVEQITRPNSLFLSAAVQNRNEQLWPLFAWFLELHLFNVPGRAHRRTAWYPQSWLRRVIEGERSERRQPGLFPDDRPSTPRFDSFRSLLHAADIGIVDIKFADDEDGDEASKRSRPHSRRIVVQHRSDVAEAWLPLEEESQGTRTLFQIGPRLLDAIGRGGVLVVDELEASLHPLLALQILQQFNDPQLNPHNAQLVFSTHDTNLLGSTVGDAVLRRDQVWLTEKDDDGGTCLYPLADFKPRKVENLERGYLQGRYGAIPFLGDLAPSKE